MPPLDPENIDTHEQPAALSPELTALREEFCRAIERRARRHRTVKTGIITAGTCLALSGTAFAAGEATGVIDLGGGETATPVTVMPVFNPRAPGNVDGFTTGKSGAAYTYHVTGGLARGVGPCGPDDQHPTNNIYVEASHELTHEQLEEIRIGLSDSSPQEQTEERQWLKEATKARMEHRAAPADPTKRPPWPSIPGVTGINNGCPTPGVGDQPGTPGSQAQPGTEAVTETPDAAQSAGEGS